MEGFLIFGILGITGMIWFFIRKTRNIFAYTIESSRSPRDIGVVILCERFGQPVPADNDQIVNRSVHASKNAPPRANESSVSRQDTLTILEGVAQGAWFGMDVIQNLMHIDEHVYTAMGTLAGKQLDTIGDLSQYLKEWPSAELGQALPEAAITKLMGHLAEPIVAQNLENLGIQIEMPDLSNQEGYDLILNGEYFANVKTVADASNLTSHFDKYPKIPVIVPEDMAGIPEGSISFGVDESIDKLVDALELENENIVLVDNQLARAEMGEHAEAISDGLTGNVDVGFPLITLALSGFREIRLLTLKNTNLISAAKNLGLDLIGTGGGGAAGASLGASLGSFIPGIGTVVGALIGGIGGAVWGRLGTNKLKRGRLKKAVKKYNKESEKAGKKIQASREEIYHRYKSSVQAIREDLTRTKGLLKSELEKENADLIQQRRKIYRISSTDAHKLLDSTLVALKRERQYLLSIPVWKRMIIGRELNYSLQKQILSLYELSQRLETEAGKIIGSRNELVGDRVLQFLQLVLCVGEEEINIRNMVRSFEVHRSELEANWQGAIMEKREQLAEKRFTCMKELSENIYSLQKTLNEKVGAICEELEPLLQSCETQLERLGKKSQRSRRKRFKISEMISIKIRAS